jgi:predicted nucleic acid-binding protein
MIVVADSSPLRYLIVIGAVHLLPELFGETWVPSAVLAELSAVSTPSDVRAFLGSAPDWLRVGEPTEESLAAVSRELDWGERAALALGRDLKAGLLLLDDAAGRTEARALGFRVTGTIGLLRLAAELSLIDPKAIGRTAPGKRLLHERIVAPLRLWGVALN